MTADVHQVGAVLELRRESRNVRVCHRITGAEVVLERADLPELLEVLSRFVCAEFGHVIARASKEPVMGPFNLCLRCGQWERV